MFILVSFDDGSVRAYPDVPLKISNQIKERSVRPVRAFAPSLILSEPKKKADLNHS